MGFEEVKAWLLENKSNAELQALMQELTPISEASVKKYFETDAGKILLKSLTDSAVSKGIETWKGNNLDKIVEEKYREKNPPKSKVEIELDEIKQQLAKKDKEAEQAKIRAEAIRLFTDEKIPLKFLDITKEVSIEELPGLVSSLKEVIKSINDEVSQRYFNENSRDIPKPNGGDANGNPWLSKNFNLTKQGEILTKDPAKAKRLMHEAGVRVI